MQVDLRQDECAAGAGQRTSEAGDARTSRTARVVGAEGVERLELSLIHI